MARSSIGLLSLYRLIDNSATEDEPLIAVMSFRKGPVLLPVRSLINRNIMTADMVIISNNLIRTDTDRLLSQTDFCLAILLLLQMTRQFFPKFSMFDSLSCPPVQRSVRYSVVCILRRRFGDVFDTIYSRKQVPFDKPTRFS